MHIHGSYCLYGYSVQVQLNISIRALEYNTTGAYYSCSLSDRDCTLQLHFPKGNEVLLTSPGPDQVFICLATVYLCFSFYSHFSPTHASKFNFHALKKSKTYSLS